jgi:hypothetical protein
VQLEREGVCDSEAHVALHTENWTARFGGVVRFGLGTFSIVYCTEGESVVKRTYTFEEGSTSFMSTCVQFMHYVWVFMVVGGDIRMAA